MTETTQVWVCTNCQTRYEPGPGAVCPTCRRPDHYGQGVQPNMPKITRHEGATNKDAEAAGTAGPAASGTTLAGGSERSSDGSSSSTSSGATPKTQPQNEPNPPAPAPGVESPSTSETGSATAPAATTSGPETPKAYAAKSEWVEFVKVNGWPTEELGDPNDRTKAELIDWWTSP
jgi:hypothetical protein